MSQIVVHKFDAMLDGEIVPAVVATPPDGAPMWSLLVDVGDVPGLPYLAYGPCRPTIFYNRDQEVPALKLIKTGKACSAEDADEVGPLPAFLNDALRMRSLAAPSGLYIWEGDTFLRDHEGVERFRLLGNDPRSRSIEHHPF